MTKMKKLLSVGLITCMASSAMLMGAGAVNTTVSKANTSNVVLNPTWGAPGSLIDKHGVDWSKTDMSMCVLGQDYHFYSQDGVASGSSASASSRYYFSGWVYGIPKNAGTAPNTFSLSVTDDLAFQADETGTIQVQATDTTSGIKTANILVFDVTDSHINDWITLDIGGSPKKFVVDPTHEYRFYLGNSHVAGAQVRVQIELS